MVSFSFLSTMIFVFSLLYISQITIGKNSIDHTLSKNRYDISPVIIKLSKLTFNQSDLQFVIIIIHSSFQLSGARGQRGAVGGAVREEVNAVAEEPERGALQRGHVLAVLLQRCGEVQQTEHALSLTDPNDPHI